MRPRWDDLSARARGLGTRLLDSATLDRLAQASDIHAVARVLAGTPYDSHIRRTSDRASAAEGAVASYLMERIGTLLLWAGDRRSALAPAFLPFDAASLRGILRGLRAGVVPEERAAFALPSPLLGPRELSLLSRVDSVGAVAGTLRVWDHPMGEPLGRAWSEASPSDFSMEAALGQGLSAGVVEAGWRSDPRIVEQLRREIDVWNVTTALILAGADTETPADELFLSGGSRVSEDLFHEAVSAAGRRKAARRLAEGVRGTPLEQPLAAPYESVGRIEDGLRAALTEELRREGRRRPLSVCPVLWFVSALRREAEDVRGAVARARTRGRGGLR